MSQEIEALLGKLSGVEERMIIVAPREQGEHLVRLAKENGIIIDVIERESVQDRFEREIKRANEVLGDKVREQEYLKALGESLEEEVFKREHENDPGPAERRRIKDMKRQQQLARRYSSKFKK